VTILLAWLLADFLSGIVHWAEDRRLTKETRWAFLNSLKADNDLHHASPAALTRLSWYQNLSTSLPFTAPLAALLMLIGAPAVIYLTLYFVGFANLIHRWAHEPRGKLPWPVLAIQSTGLFITFKHHWGHHADENGLVTKEQASVRYCAMTNWLNPVLDRVGFWRLLERFI
jgi:hypothetical protein